MVKHIIEGKGGDVRNEYAKSAQILTENLVNKLQQGSPLTPAELQQLYSIHRTTFVESGEARFTPRIN